jgi:hypothetical protein
LKEFKSSNHPKEQVLASLFLHLADWHAFLGKMNSAVMKENVQKGNVKKKARPCTEEEFLTAIGLLIAAAEYGQ